MKPRPRPLTAAEAAHTVANKRWRKETGRRTRAVLGAGLHERVEAVGQPLCQPLADLADEMESAVDTVQELLADAVASTLDGLAPPALARLVARRFVEHTTARQADAVAAVVKALRVCGVALCALGGVADLARCPCLSALARGLAEDEVESEITTALRGGLAPFRAAEAAA